MCYITIPELVQTYCNTHNSKTYTTCSKLSPGATENGIIMGMTLVASRLCVKPNFLSPIRCLKMPLQHVNTSLQLHNCSLIMILTIYFVTLKLCLTQTALQQSQTSTTTLNSTFTLQLSIDNDIKLSETLTLTTHSHDNIDVLTIDTQ